MKRTRLRPLLGLLLTLSMLVSLAAPAFAAETRETDFFSKFPQEVDFSALTYGEPSTQVLAGIIEKLDAAAKKADNTEAVTALMTELAVEYGRFNTEYAVFNAAYYNDPAALSEEYLSWDSVGTRFENLYSEAIQDVLASPNREAVALALGEDEAAYRASVDVDTPEQQELLDRCAELINQYWNKVVMDATVTYQGTAYHDADEAYAAYLNDTLTYEEFTAIHAEMIKAVNAVVGPLFVELVGLYNEYARSKGEESFADYQYRTYFGRDYSPEDASAIHESVKKYIAPLGGLITTLAYGSEALQASSTAMAPLFADLAQEDILEMVEPYMGCVSSEYAELYDYMRRCDLVDIGPSDTKNSAGFTADLPDYDSAYIFNKPNGSYYDVETLIHEFGHFAEACLSSNTESGLSFDVAEIDSQGLEMLYLPYIDDMIGEDAAAGYRLNVLYSFVLNACVNGCILDEFQQRAYAEEDLTLDKLNAIYHDVLVEYGQGNPDDTYAYDWYQVHHNYEQPFYYISYCTSALAALEILELSLTDHDAACDTYLKLVEQGAGSLNGFRNALGMAGLSDVFEEKTVAGIAGAIEDYLYGEICGVSFTDLDGSWAEDDARLCAALGLFSGAPDGSFQPNATLTRDQVVSLLWRVNGEPEAENTASFEDVSANAWYAGAADWAYEAGLVQGTSGKAAYFTPNVPVTRQELAVLLYRMAGSPEVEDADLSAYTDANELSAWTADAMAWCVENGLLQGQSGTLLAPNAQLTRGEAAAVLAKLY